MDIKPNGTMDFTIQENILEVKIEKFSVNEKYNKEEKLPNELKLSLKIELKESSDYISPLYRIYGPINPEMKVKTVIKVLPNGPTFIGDFEPINREYDTSTRMFFIRKTQAQLYLVKGCLTLEITTTTKILEKVSDNLGELIRKENNMLYPDFKFKIGNAVFPVHRAVLAARSSVFNEQFNDQGIYKEKTEADFSDLRALEPECQEKVFTDFLNFIYTGIVKDLNLDKNLQKLAIDYKIDALIKVCEEYFSSTAGDLETYKNDEDFNNLSAPEKEKTIQAVNEYLKQMNFDVSVNVLVTQRKTVLEFLKSFEKLGLKPLPVPMIDSTPNAQATEQTRFKSLLGKTKNLFKCVSKKNSGGGEHSNGEGSDSMELKKPLLTQPSGSQNTDSQPGPSTSTN